MILSLFANWGGVADGEDRLDGFTGVFDAETAAVEDVLITLGV